MGRFNRNGIYRSKHSKQCQELKDDILRTAAEVRKWMEMGHNKKALLKHYARQFSASGDKHYLVLIKHQRNIIQGYARQTQVLVNKLISMKSEYHQLYRKTAKVLQYAEY